MRLLIYSDLHLEANHFSPVLPTGRRADEDADLVILAGDIAEGTRGIRWARETFSDKRTLYVCGNHEFYGGHWTRTLDDMRTVASACDVDFLEADSVDIDGIRFLGVCLWTDFCLSGASNSVQAMQQVQATMNDYSDIQTSRAPEHFPAVGKYLTPSMTADRHKGSVAWLERQLLHSDAAKTVVVTHHAPHPQSLHKSFKDDPLSSAYASDLSRCMGNTSLWVHGHVHHSVDYQMAGTRVVSNPRGVLHQSGAFQNDHFQLDFVVGV
jgi:Icc-related predicted phosphoesterase